MSGKQYLKNQLSVILINLLGMLALALFLIASDNPIQTVLFILAVWSIVLVLSLLTFYFSRKKYLNKLLNMTEQLEERYLLPEIMQVPERADEQVFYQIMKMAEKSMLERIGEVQRERREYKEYIEQWIHEVKTPITAMKLLCENNRSPFSREVLAAGSHSISIVSANGVATANFEVQTADTTAVSPKTGDNGQAALWITLLLLSCGALTAVGIRKKVR